jgi:hypothetical protein
MITVIVEFALPSPMGAEEAKAVFLATAPRYLGLPGLVRKYYYVTPEGDKAGGVYLWASRADAQRVYTESWKDFVRAKYGSEPRLTYLETPVVVDNPSQQILSD